LIKVLEAPCKERVPEVQGEKIMGEVLRALEVLGVPGEAAGLERVLEALGEEWTGREALGEEGKGQGAPGEEERGLGVLGEEWTVPEALGEVERDPGALGEEGSAVLVGGGLSPPH